jgi:hypothetical protein
MECQVSNYRASLEGYLSADTLQRLYAETKSRTDITAERFEKYSSALLLHAPVSLDDFYKIITELMQFRGLL